MVYVSEQDLANEKKTSNLLNTLSSYFSFLLDLLIIAGPYGLFLRLYRCHMVMW